MADQELVTSSENTLTREEIALGLLYPMPPQMSEDEKVGLVERLGGRERGIQLQKVAIRLVQGWPRSLAIVGSGLSDAALRHECQKDPLVSRTLAQLEDAGFQSKFVTELYRRAMAGTDDRGSVRALEMVVKARDVSYQEKSALHLHVIAEAEASIERGNQVFEQLQEAGQFA